MDWLTDLLTKDSIAHSILVLGVAISLGMLVGRLQFRGVALGVAGVFFAGILVAHAGLRTNHETLHFMRDFGLVLFALGFVTFGALLAVGAYLLSGFSAPVMVGIMSGAYTNTPGLGAAQQTLHDLAQHQAGLDTLSPALGYAVTYPFGILAPILAMLVGKYVLRIDLAQELTRYRQSLEAKHPAPLARTLVVRNQAIFGRALGEVIATFDAKIVVSRVMHGQRVFTPTDETALGENDKVRVVGTAGELDKMELLIGPATDDLIMLQTGNLVAQQVYISNPKIVGETLAELNLNNREGVNITRINRSGLELLAQPTSMLLYGDQVTVVGEEEAVAKIAKELGNSPKRLDYPDIFPVFVGMVLGVVVGSLPFHFPALPSPVKLGLAGGPLIVAILISRYGRIGKAPAYLPASANLMLREVGIALFLASVGLLAGEKFVDSLVNGAGLQWLAYGLAISLLHLTVGLVVLHFFMRRNFVEICGLLAGCCTNPPALAFAQVFTATDYPASVYATVFPLATFLRIIAAQLLLVGLLVLGP